MELLKKHAGRIVLLILVLFFAVSLVVSRQESTTMDEKAHIPAGYSYVRYGDMRINPEHPPMLKDFAGLPLLLLDPQPVMPQSDPLWESGDWLDKTKFPEGPARTWGLAQWNFGDTILHQNGNDADAITFWSRFPIVLVAMLLGFFVYRWTKELGGTLAGLFALVLYAFDPNIIAHSHYVTTDIGIAAFIFMSMYYFVRFLKDPSGKNVILSGLFLGLAELAKFSAVLLFPIFGLFTVAYALTFQVNGTSVWKAKFLKLWEYLWKYAASVAVAFVAIWILYFVNTINMPGEVIAEIARAQFPNDRSLGRLAETAVIAMSNVPVLKPLAEYFLGVFMVFARVAGGNTFYFLGTVSNHADPWYFPVVFFLKETLPFLFLLLFTTLYTLYRIGRSVAMEETKNIRSLWNLFARSFQHRIAQYLAAFFILFYAYVSITGNLNIGFRHLFPILPFLYMLVGKTAFDFLKRHQEEIATHGLIRFALGAVVLVIIAIPVLSYPSYLSYFNPIGGGHENGYKYVTDSNYDWGQDLKRLRNFVDQYNGCQDSTTTSIDCTKIPFVPGSSEIDKIHVDYFGGSNPQYYLGDKYVPTHGEAAPGTGWYAVSIGFLQESTHKELKPGDMSYRWLVDNHEPVARAGDSIFIYYVPEEE